MRKFVIVVLSLLVAATAVAQNTDIEALSGLQFNFGNPGARSMGMGGAFLGLADDASAAEANPAGLTVLRDPEVSMEGRNFRAVQELNTGGVFPDLTSEQFSTFSRRAEIGFASFVFPVKNFAFAAYYHQPLNYTNAFAVPSPPSFYLPRGNPPGSGTPVTGVECANIRRQTGDGSACVDYAALPFATGTNIDLKTWAIAGAWKRGEFSVGAAVRYQVFEEVAATFRTDFQGNITSIVLQGTLSDNATAENLDTASEDDITFSVGGKWTANDKFSAGLVYKMGPEFDAPVFFADLVSNTGFQRLSDVKFHIPDIAGAGVSFKPIPTLTLNVDGVYVMYSNLFDEPSPINLAINIVDEPYESKDVLEIHAGAEYFFTTKIPFAIRAGWWRDPGHSTRFAGPLTCTDAQINVDERPLCSAIRVTQSILFPEPVDLDHYAIGVGLAWPKFQIDAAYDTSDRFKVGSLSGVFRF